MFAAFRRKRPAECRLCQCPVVDTGVPMDQLDPEKLSEWWKQKLDAKLDLRNIAQQWICQFCLWDSRLEHEQCLLETPEVVQNADCDWWNSFDTDLFFFKNYYKGQVIEQCVDVAPKKKVPKTSEEKKASWAFMKGQPQQSNCVYCDKSFSSKTATDFHVASVHKDSDWCVKCKLRFPDASSMKEHITKCHSRLNKNICHFCGMPSNNLKEHILRQHAAVLNMCKYFRCFRFFKTSAEKEIHEKEAHQSKGNFLCSYCDFHSYSKKLSLIAHIKTKHADEKLIRCQHSTGCSQIFLTEQEKAEHIEQNHFLSAVEIECEVCKVKLLRPHLNKHMREFHDRSSTNSFNTETNCCYCQKEFLSRKSAFKHVKEAHSDIETFKCHECEIIFETNDKKKEHYQKVHRGNFRCIYCVNWACTNRMNLRRHIRQKHQGVVIQCRYSNKCGLYFKTQADLQTHIKESHEGDKSNKLQCVYCSKFVQIDKLGAHMATHHKSVAIKCNYIGNCRTYFLTVKERETHILEVHQPGMRYYERKCPCCPAKFVDFADMKGHMTMKHSEKAMKCFVKPCKFVCISLEILDKHVEKQHAHIKSCRRYNCSKCVYYSYYLKNFNLHTQKVHGEENLKCQNCPDKTFKSKLAIADHIRDVHLKRSCFHCKVKYFRSSLKGHQKILKCQFCNNTFPCKVLHAKHEKDCNRLKNDKSVS